MSPLLQERATPAAAQPLQPLPLGEEQQQQLEREDSDSVSSGEDSDSFHSCDSGDEVYTCHVCVLWSRVSSRFPPFILCVGGWLGVRDCVCSACGGGSGLSWVHCSVLCVLWQTC